MMRGGGGVGRRRGREVGRPGGESGWSAARSAAPVHGTVGQLEAWEICSPRGVHKYANITKYSLGLNRLGVQHLRHTPAGLR